MCDFGSTLKKSRKEDRRSMSHDILDTESPFWFHLALVLKNLSDNELNVNDKMMSFVEDISNQDSIQAAICLFSAVKLNSK